MIELAELRDGRSETKVGYRIIVKNANKGCDFGVGILVECFDLLSRILIFRRNPLYGYIDNDVFRTGDENNIVEVNNVSEMKNYLNSMGIMEENFQYIESVLALRFEICQSMLEELQIPMGKIREVSVSPSMTRAWGMCYRLRLNNRAFKIKISEKLLTIGDIDGIDLVILHELLHTVDGCFNHGKTWKYYASLVCDYYGFNIQRLTDAEELGITAEQAIEAGYHVVQCDLCGYFYYAKSECKSIKYYNHYSCNCGGTLVRLS